MSDQSQPTTLSLPDGVEVTGDLGPRYEEILSPKALQLIAKLHRELNGRRLELLAKRKEVVDAVANGEDLHFLDETKEVREDDSWQVAPLAPGLEDRRVEMTGPTDRKMVINALNSGAKAWLADQEDANTPMWANVVEGPLNLLDAIDGSIDFTSPEGKEYKLKGGVEEQPTIIVRPRGWHLPEKHILVDGEETSGSLVDFALYLVACGQKQIDRGHGPYFYLPKMESYLEARLWNDAFTIGQDFVGIPQGTIRATCLIETFPAAFQMEEILYELRDHSSGLNAGRWDYLFSAIKTYRTRGADYVLPDRNTVTMTVPFMRAYTELLVRTCHKRGASAIGGMAAFIPSKDEAVNKNAFDKLAADKSREAGDGFDGSWVAHPGMVQACAEEFTKVLGDKPNQLDKKREDVQVTAEQLLDVKSTPGDVTEEGVRANIDVALQYLRTWLQGRGAVGINNLMEDAATAEISRSQIWQQINNQVKTADTDTLITKDFVLKLVNEVIADLPGEASEWQEAKDTFLEVAVADDYADFLTLPAYSRMP
ncbi:malate synthase A [Calidifontibacter sp. DB0510]|uniref:Malate synthase n=1 Tax=Metallococcus carri TaxID=1656884 RepID=A0A967E8V6_9MICO|nr:malate synthase A [Metallococcus carri]NHN54214.1 malate synthase A [Metallococcus carri]NOP36946.1 malate synthase A [Calidifontibacter sp. DB2511S]